MIVFEYGRYNSDTKKFVTNIELQFIWNQTDKWFGLDQKLYDITNDNDVSNEEEEEKSTETSEQE